jgi:uncharacterized protein with ACT and thioredoxin-like domain
VPDGEGAAREGRGIAPVLYIERKVSWDNAHGRQVILIRGTPTVLLVAKAVIAFADHCSVEERSIA